MPVSTLKSNGQITIPKSVREQLHLVPGDRIDFRVEEDGSARIVPKPLKAADVLGILSDDRQKALSPQEMDQELTKAFREGRLP